MRLSRATVAGVLRLDSTSDLGDNDVYAGYDARYGVAGWELRGRGLHQVVIKRFLVRTFTHLFDAFRPRANLIQVFPLRRIEIVHSPPERRENHVGQQARLREVPKIVV